MSETSLQIPESGLSDKGKQLEAGFSWVLGYVASLLWLLQ